MSDTTDRFDNYFEWLIPWEGSTYENDPDDPGGATKYGIDQRSHPNVNIRTLTKAHAKTIYRNEYWSRVKAGDLPFPVGEVVMDIAVNNGAVRAGKWLQDATGAAVDGIIGPRTIAAAKAMDAGALAVALLSRRETFYRSLAKGAMAKYLRGWLNRNNSLKEEIGY